MQLSQLMTVTDSCKIQDFITYAWREDFSNFHMYLDIKQMGGRVVKNSYNNAHILNGWPFTLFINRKATF